MKDVVGQHRTKTVLYDTMSSTLSERSRKRDLWAKREDDSTFRRVPKGSRPLPFPVTFKDSTEAETHSIKSPLPSDLEELTKQVKDWGR